MNNEPNMEAIRGLIVNGGNAKSLAFEAINAAKKNDFGLADSKLKEADQALIEAHNAQTAMLTEEAKGNHEKVTLLTVHSKDHIMNAITFRDLAGEMVDLYKRISSEVKVEG